MVNSSAPHKNCLPGHFFCIFADSAFALKKVFLLITTNCPFSPFLDPPVGRLLSAEFSSKKKIQKTLPNKTFLGILSNGPKKRDWGFFWGGQADRSHFFPQAQQADHALVGGCRVDGRAVAPASDRLCGGRRGGRCGPARSVKSGPTGTRESARDRPQWWRQWRVVVGVAAPAGVGWRPAAGQRPRGLRHTFTRCALSADALRGSFICGACG